MAEPRPLSQLTAADLEGALTELGPQVAYPATPDLAGGVRARIQDESRPISLGVPVPWLPEWLRIGGDNGGRRRRRPYRIGGGAWLAAAVVLAIVAGLLALFPEARSAIADRLGLRGIGIEWIEDAPAPAPSPAGARLMLGRAVTIDEARAAVDFPVVVPMKEAFANPPEVYLMGESEGPMVSFVYPPSPGLPQSEVAGVGALLTQFRGEAERNLIEKGLLANGEDPQTRLETVTVNGNPGFWITGAPHAVFFVCYDAGECRQERYRLAGNVLLWEQDGVTLRLESALARDEAVAIAESVTGWE